jgi:hypothetical protein
MYTMGDTATINGRAFRIKNRVFRPVEHLPRHWESTSAPETAIQFLSYNTRKATESSVPIYRTAQGIHYCLGAPLARLEGEIALRALIQHVLDLRLAAEPGDLAWRTCRSSAVWCACRLPGMRRRHHKSSPARAGGKFFTTKTRRHEAGETTLVQRIIKAFRV